MDDDGGVRWLAGWLLCLIIKVHIGFLERLLTSASHPKSVWYFCMCVTLLNRYTDDIRRMLKVNKRTLMLTRHVSSLYWFPEKWQLDGWQYATSSPLSGRVCRRRGKVFTKHGV